MKRWLLIIGLLLNTLAAQEMTNKSGTANYDLTARLLPVQKAVQGSYKLEWWNFSKDTVREMQFHLYLNAFKNERSTFFKEGGGRTRSSSEAMSEQDCGWIDSLEFSIDGTKLPYEFIQMDDENEDDQTVIRISLPHPVWPQSSIRIDGRFYSKLPRVFERTGFTEDEFYMIAQWYPKIGVWENGQWNCHQFHANSEFYADFGDYRMRITVPSEYIVGANAQLEKKETYDSTTTYHFFQKNVIDAVWTASPHFTEMKQTVASGERSVEVTYLFSPGREKMAERYRACVPAMFQYFYEWIGEYPYPNFTIVDVPLGEELASGGMEYPTLVTTGSYFGPYWMNRFVDNSFLEVVTFHEFAHNYFQSMLASNEFEEPWLDEGFASYAEHRALERYFNTPGKVGLMFDIGGAAYTSMDYHRSSYLKHPDRGTVAGKSWVIPRSFYQTAVYSKPVLILTTLERYLGRSVMDKILSTYYQRWRFKHPKTQDFIDVVNNVSGRDMQWFFDQFIFTSKAVDYEVVDITYETDEASGLIHNIVNIRNNGEAVMPVSICFRFENSDSLTAEWDGKATERKFEFNTTSKIVSCWIDPEKINVMDVRWSNNFLSVESSYEGIARYTLRIQNWVQSLLMNLSVFI
ncbi:M1 family metallopeptidase [bacterium]|nr:M1 family metallopeptidase [bacterium]